MDGVVAQKETKKPTRRNRISVYLAGAVDGVPHDYAAGWRRVARCRLEGLGKDVVWEVIDPLRFGGFDVLQCIMSVTQCDVLLVEMDYPGHPYIGTSSEMAWAWEHGKFIVVWGRVGRYSRFRQCFATVDVDTLDEALEAIRMWADAKMS